MRSYWVNSNTGDYITESNGVYKLYLIPRGQYPDYLPGETINITSIQFKALKGFVPIKEKKLFGRTSGLSQRGKYAPTLSGGVKGEAERIKVPTTAEIRNNLLTELGLK
jgi:hypothetical protein